VESACQVVCDDLVALNVIHVFNASSLDVLHRGSSRPHRLRTSFTEEGLGHLQGLVHHSPHEFGKDHGTWTLELVAQVCLEQGIVAVSV
jgi:hypothetical protein